jgi:hypothetical protein
MVPNPSAIWNADAYTMRNNSRAGKFRTLYPHLAPRHGGRPACPPPGGHCIQHLALFQDPEAASNQSESPK